MTESITEVAIETRDHFENAYWQYYLFLEKQLLTCRDYVDFSEKNNDVCSVAFSQLLLSVGGELDNVFKLICEKMDKDAPRGCIGDYKAVLLCHWKEIVKEEVEVHYSDFTIKPFVGWTLGGLSWWSAYSNVKHYRAKNYESANLNNVLSIMAALYLLEMKAFLLLAKENESDIPSVSPALFTIRDWQTRHFDLLRLQPIVVHNQ